MWSRQLGGFKNLLSVAKISKSPIKSLSHSIPHPIRHSPNPFLGTHSTLGPEYHRKRGFSNKPFDLPSYPDLIRWRFRLSFLVGTGAISYLVYERMRDDNTPLKQPDPEDDKIPEPLFMLSESQAESLLKKGEHHVKPATSKSFVFRMDLNSVASNDPIEDTHSEQETDQGVIVGIFDGHAGTQCSALLASYLSSYISRELKKVNISKDSLERKEKVKAALQNAFVSFDNDLLSGVFAKSQRTSSFLSWVGSNSSNGYDYDQVMEDLKGPMSGSCAIVSYIEGRAVYVACTGDSRAVMGQRTSFTAHGKESHVFLPYRLSEDQTAKNPHEYARMIQEHPGEEATVISRGRVLGGLMPTRAFGDARYKWPFETIQEVRSHVAPHRRKLVRDRYLTPPYVTARPEVVYYERTDRDVFLILATDGIWDELSDEEAVKVVGKATVGNDSSLSDSNAATALIRAALGGDSNPDRMRKLLSLRKPISRRYRDDMTVNVVLFDEIIPQLTKTGQNNPVQNVTALPTADSNLPLSRSPKLNELLEYLRARAPIPPSKL